MLEKPLIHVIEDDVQISDFLQLSLQSQGYVVKTSRTLAQATAAFFETKPALVILDLNLPDGDGRQFIREARQQSDIPILVLSARQMEQEKVDCFTDGADDYLAKPFGVHELVARVKVALKRSTMMSLRDHIVRIGPLMIDREHQAVTLNDEALHLTPIELKLLLILARKPGKAYSHRQLLTEVWGAEYVDDTHYLRIHMGRLRARIETNTAAPSFILTEAGVGYRLASA
ncbi:MULTISPECIES: response regulator [unclassified Methylotenera]|uniref:response regulator n=1 Tax=unclassified Methylotenera TaxID=2643294 RepID=UPI0003AA0E46|nr:MULTISPECIES: response regulator [unclassified Methylotenera]